MSRVAEILGAAIYPDAPGYKVAGGTSQEAATAIEGRAVILRKRVVERLRQFPGGLTADEIAEHLGEDILSIRPRCSELRRSHEIKPGGLRRRNKSGKAADVLVIADQSATPSLSPHSARRWEPEIF